MKKFLPKNSKTSGFTLIELLVVIAIIAVLAVMGFAVFSGLTGRGNDDRRQVDIKAIGDVYEVKRTPKMADYGTLTLVGNDFAGGTIPADPFAARAYCIRTSTTGVVSNAAVPGDINASGVCVGGAGNGSTGWNTVAGTALAASTTNWKVCALLSDNTTVVCVGSKQ